MSEKRTSSKQETGSKEHVGLSRARIDLVNRYLAEAHGPPPRLPLRFWIGGEWVEVASPEPEPLPRAVGEQEVATMELTHPPAALERRPDAPPDPKAVAARGIRVFGRNDDAVEVASRLREFGQRDDHDLVRGTIASLREQRDAGEISHTDFATRVAELLNGHTATPIGADGDPFSP